MTSLRISALTIYPIKACAGIELQQAELVRTGLAFDRRWMVVDPRGEFVTQRDLSQLTLVRTRLLPASSAGSGGFARLGLEAPDSEPFELPLTLSTGPELEVRVWRSQVVAFEHVAGGSWFSRALRRELRLVYMPEASARQVSLSHGRAGDVVSFADGYPLLLISEASLSALNQRLDQPVTMNRFRPNLVVQGCAPHAEDEWLTFEAAGLPLRVAKACERCVVTTVEPHTGLRQAEPLRTLAQYRKVGKQVLFGVNIIHGQTGWVRVGDEVRVQSTRQ